MDILKDLFDFISSAFGNGFNDGRDYVEWMWDGGPAIWNGDGGSPVLTP